MFIESLRRGVLKAIKTVDKPRINNSIGLYLNGTEANVERGEEESDPIDMSITTGSNETSIDHQSFAAK